MSFAKAAAPEPLKRLLRPIRNFFRRTAGAVRYRLSPGGYWEKRHRAYDSDMRAVGPGFVSNEEILRIYAEGEESLRRLLELQPGYADGAFVEIGCGNGYWAGFLKRLGVRSYTGLDISPYAVAKLGPRFPEYHFAVQDITEGLGGLPEQSADFILMLDVAQHIVDDGKFQRAMENLRRLLRPRGVILMTANLSDPLKDDVYYVKRRPVSVYRDAFPGFEFSEPRPFNAKHVFAMRRGKA